jgi:hypothetical protein
LAVPEMTETSLDIVERLRKAGLRDGFAVILYQHVQQAADEIEQLRKRRQTELLAPSISWNGFLVSGRQESLDEVWRLIDLEKRGHK